MQDAVGCIVDMSGHLVRAFLRLLKFRPFVFGLGEMVQPDLISFLECSRVKGIRTVVTQPPQGPSRSHVLLLLR
jgi:hypothetical protein